MGQIIVGLGPVRRVVESAEEDWEHSIACILLLAILVLIGWMEGHV